MLPSAVLGQASAEPPEEPETQERASPRVELSTFRAQVRPELEVILPTGAITQYIPLRVGRFGVDTTLGYAVNGNELDGEMVFSYRLGRVLPELRFFQSVDFEDYVSPGFDTGGVKVFSEEEFVSRRRGTEPRVSVTVLPNTRVGTALAITDVFDWSLTESELVDEGLNLVPEVFLIYDNMKALQPNRNLELEGVAAKLSVSQLFRERFDVPVSAEVESRLLLQFLLGDNWSFKEQFTANSIVEVWREDLLSPYRLGGSGSIRGYLEDEFEAMRVGIASTEFARRVLRSLDTSFAVRERRRVQIHQHRVFLLNDVAVTQRELDLDSEPSFYGSAGVGLGTVVSLGRIHFDVSVAAVQAFDVSRLPVYYFRTTLFNFERRQ